MELTTEIDYDIRRQMWFTQKLESIGKSIRKKIGAPNKLKLFEAQVEIWKGKTQIFLLKGYRDLLGDEDGLNVDYVEPFFQKSGYGHWERAGKVIDGYRLSVQLCTIISPKNELVAMEKKEYRKNMMEEKKAGTYTTDTYKKYKK